MMIDELIKKEQELDKTKDEIAMRIGYKVLEISNLLNQYKEAEKPFLEMLEKAKHGK